MGCWREVDVLIGQRAQSSFRGVRFRYHQQADPERCKDSESRCICRTKESLTNFTKAVKHLISFIRHMTQARSRARERKSCGMWLSSKRISKRAWRQRRMDANHFPLCNERAISGLASISIKRCKSLGSDSIEQQVITTPNARPATHPLGKSAAYVLRDTAQRSSER